MVEPRVQKKRKKKKHEKDIEQLEEGRIIVDISEAQEPDQVPREAEEIEERRRKKDKNQQKKWKVREVEEESDWHFRTGKKHQVLMEDEATEGKSRTKEKKQEKRKGKEVEEQSGGLLDVKKQDQVLRDEEGTEEKKRKKEKKRKMKELEQERARPLHLKEREEEGGWCLESKEETQHLQTEEEVPRQLSSEENVTLLKGGTAMRSGALVPSNLSRDPTAGDTDKEKKAENKRKRVRFEEHIVAADQEQAMDVPTEAAVYTSEGAKHDVEEVWGVRFTPEEDAILKDAVWTYIKSKGWDEHAGLEKVFNSKKHKDARGCWAEIKMSLPHRPRQAVRVRARLLLETGAHLGKWSKEEEDFLIRLQNERGHKWRDISSVLNRHRTSIKEKWRSLKRTEKVKKRGGWTQEELQLLSDMVHKSLKYNRLQAAIKEKPDRHILRDNIAWEEIADTLGTHNHGPCCSKWYYNLQSSLVSDGLWANLDDFLLLKSLLESGASAEEEVEWDNLLEHRSGQVCLTRWQQMIKHLGENRTRQFLDKLDILARRYAPELLEKSAEDNSSKEPFLPTAQAT